MGNPNWPLTRSEGDERSVDIEKEQRTLCETFHDRTITLGGIGNPLLALLLGASAENQQFAVRGFEGGS
ncbi:hypothetical protein Airi02_040130 [Actinoallomurus iriomotensis]|uniref:Uncharacterized protein n=1 Tax=Actinoallomurus iriomotensis TaxID=478107 RepID=A0A9W6S2W1_9ACTN|nr:hypothetical protein Airi02_040130 [Actinoallomurus iriomotensis]